jgi:hypothetical protein
MKIKFEAITNWLGGEESHLCYGRTRKECEKRVKHKDVSVPYRIREVVVGDGRVLGVLVRTKSGTVPGGEDVVCVPTSEYFPYLVRHPSRDI